jgi:hypothetical protein
MLTWLKSLDKLVMTGVRIPTATLRQAQGDKQLLKRRYLCDYNRYCKTFSNTHIETARSEMTFKL